MMLQRCTTWYGTRVHLTDAPNLWLVEGKTLCGCGVFIFLDGPADARPVDCKRCRATAERFADYIADALAGVI